MDSTDTLTVLIPSFMHFLTESKMTQTYSPVFVSPHTAILTNPEL